MYQNHGQENDGVTPVERVLTALEENGCEPKTAGKAWSARCPAHPDQRPSLSIDIGDDGRCLLDCKAGCDTTDVVAEIGLEMGDLFSYRSDASTKPPNSLHKGKKRRRRSGPVGKYATADEAIDALESQMGPSSARWIYHDASGDQVGVVLRWDKSDGKMIRPVSRHDDRWTTAGMHGYRYDNKYEMLNEVVLNLWIYGEAGMGYGCPKKCIFYSCIT